MSRRSRGAAKADHLRHARSRLWMRRATARPPCHVLAEAARRRRPAEACRFLNRRHPSRLCQQPRRQAKPENPPDFTSVRLGTGFAVPMSVTKRFVYGLRSMTDQTRFYTGVTSNVSARIEWHNAGPCSGAGGNGTRPATEWCHRSGPDVHSAPLEVSRICFPHRRFAAAFDCKRTTCCKWITPGSRHTVRSDK
jgi:hypothetical protein